MNEFYFYIGQQAN